MNLFTTIFCMFPTFCMQEQATAAATSRSDNNQGAPAESQFTDELLDARCLWLARCTWCGFRGNKALLHLPGRWAANQGEQQPSPSQNGSSTPEVAKPSCNIASHMAYKPSYHHSTCEVQLPIERVLQTRSTAAFHSACASRGEGGRLLYVLCRRRGSFRGTQN